MRRTICSICKVSGCISQHCSSDLHRPVIVFFALFLALSFPLMAFGEDSSYLDGSGLFGPGLKRVRSLTSNPGIESVVQLDFIDDLSGPLYELSQIKKFGNVLDSMVLETASEVERIFGQSLEETIVVRVLSPSQFDSYTAAPKWSSALFSRGEIVFRISSPSTRSWRSLRRSLRHELIHRAVAEFSDSRCPVWLEEGLAQYFSGETTRHIAETLRDASKTMHSLSSLDDSFMDMDPTQVPRSYAHSIFAVRSLVNRYGFSRIGAYLKLLGQGSSKESAFLTAFGISFPSFDAQIEKQIRMWRKSGKRML